MYPFSENGGVVPKNGEELIKDLKIALLNTNYGKENADNFIKNRVHLPNGKTCTRIISDLKNWIHA